MVSRDNAARVSAPSLVHVVQPTFVQRLVNFVTQSVVIRVVLVLNLNYWNINCSTDLMPLVHLRIACLFSMQNVLQNGSLLSLPRYCPV